MKDDESEFYRSVVSQREGMSAALKTGGTTQGFYIFAPDGKIIEGWNNHDEPKMQRLLKKSLKNYQPPKSDALGEAGHKRDFSKLSVGGMVIDVFSKITEANWPPAEDRWEKMFQQSTGRDHLWLTKKDLQSLASGTLPDSVAQRIARYHLIDNTRGEPPMWKAEEVRALKMTLTPDGEKFRLDGDVRLATEKGNRGYDAKLFGYVESKGGKLTRLDLVARGQFWGHGEYTSNSVPIGKFTLAIAFTIADQNNEAAKVPPQGYDRWGDYLKE